jgi:hypothetical protein
MFVPGNYKYHNASEYAITNDLYDYINFKKLNESQAFEKQKGKYSCEVE